MSTRIESALVTMLLIASSGPLAAQMPPGGISPVALPFAPDNTIDWPTDPDYGSPPTFGRMVVADVNGDGDKDGIVLSNGIPVLLWNIALFEAPHLIEFPTQAAPTNVKGLAVLPGGGGDRDALLMTDARGLFLVTYGEDGFDDPTILENQAWANASPIHVEDLDINGFPDLIGVSSNHLSILTLLGTTGGFGPGNAAASPTAASDVVAVHWTSSSGSPQRELIALTPRGLRIYTYTCALIGTISFNANSGCITRVRSADMPNGEMLAWARPTSPTTSELVLKSSLLSRGPWPLTFDMTFEPIDVMPVAMLAGHYNDNQDEDLLLVHQGNQTAVLLVNQGQSPNFQPANTGAFDIIPLSDNPLAIGSAGIPAFAQIDTEPPGPGNPYDNPDDIAFPVSASQRIHVFLRLPYEKQITTGQPPHSGDIFRAESDFALGTVPNVDSGALRVAFHVLPKYSDYNFAELTVWRQDNETDYVQENAISFSRYQLAASGGEASPFQYTPPLTLFPNGECWGTEPVGPYFYTQLRFVKTGAPEVRSRAFTAGFRLKNCDDNLDYRNYLLGMGIPGTGFSLLDNNGLPPGSLGGHAVVGIYVPMSSQPPFEPGADLTTPTVFTGEANVYTPQ